MKFCGIKEEQEYNIDFDVETLSVEEPPVEYEYDNSLDIGEKKVKQQGSNSMAVNVYKIKKLDGKIISRTLLSQDSYRALEKVVLTSSNY